MVALTGRGLYCATGDFYIDPWDAVDRAVITHAHAGRLHPGSRVCVTAKSGAPLVRAILGDAAAVESVDYGESIFRNGVRVSLHPAGHILGSAQVRIEHAGEVWVVSGDYKLEPDPTCAPFESLRCHTFLTECTFGLPIFRWPAQAGVLEEIHAWWRANQDAGKASVLFAHPLGKAQRVLATLDPAIGPIYAHDVIDSYARIYREAGVPLPAASSSADWPRTLILAPPMASNDPWLRRFGRISTALASGWMRVRGTRRRRSLDRGFVLSDHADWPRLLAAIESTGAARVFTTHGYRGPVARWLQENGVDGQPLELPFAGEADE